MSLRRAQSLWCVPAPRRASHRERDRESGGAWLSRVSAAPRPSQPHGAPRDVPCTELCLQPLRRGLLGATSERVSWGCWEHRVVTLCFLFVWKFPGKDPCECISTPVHLAQAVWAICHGHQRPCGETLRRVPGFLCSVCPEAEGRAPRPQIYLLVCSFGRRLGGPCSAIPGQAGCLALGGQHRQEQQGLALWGQARLVWGRKRPSPLTSSTPSAG